jgi:hypothetical protein
VTTGKLKDGVTLDEVMGFLNKENHASMKEIFDRMTAAEAELETTKRKLAKAVEQRNEFITSKYERRDLLISELDLELQKKGQGDE